MAKQKSRALHFIAWLTGIIVSLAVGFGLTAGTLVVPYIGIINVIAGWIVVVTTLISLVLAIIHQ